MDILGHFEEEQFHTELLELFKAWQKTWCFPDSGPTRGVPGKLISDKPQHQAYENLLDYIATSIAIANQFEEGELVIRALRYCWGSFAGGSQSDPEYINVLHDIFARSLRTMRTQVNTGRDRDVTGFIETQRAQFKKALGFGYTKTEQPPVTA